ncbi:MAG TPA: tRNA uridine-5-carboxymethylaminomethyl(34) synthesis GTPase MnmE [Verrucomicrobiota bacterium]|nr:tRNA uridine-5-carboxymethylaminomethyl(34) synthesis GTPase MnmE [Verrucomicrobiota bacterium]
MTVLPSPHDTIAALATPLGEGGIAVIRVSGRDALAVGDRVFAPAGMNSSRPSAADSHTVHYGHIVRDGRHVDEVLLTVFRAPRTYTREDTVEISCHGGIVIARLVLETVLAAGARLAEPGEFTQRAFLNGRLDLAQAEAVADLIHARTELAAAAAREQLAGSLSQRINQVRDDLLNTLAHIEAHIDFPDEDIAPDTQERLLSRLDQAAVFLANLQRTAREGQILRRGIRAAIVGRPNAGKSSLLNRLLGHERAIVSPIPGTTRDTVEETANMRGIPVVFVDTAGLRAATDSVEAEGVRRSRAAAAQAELVLHVLDGSEPFTAEDALLRTELSGRAVLNVLNKADLPSRINLPDGLTGVSVSCATGEGLEALKEALERLVWAGRVTNEAVPVTVNARQADALRRSEEGIRRSAAALRDGASLELVALDLRIGVSAVGEIVGKTTTDDLLDVIFHQFCLGK